MSKEYPIFDNDKNKLGILLLYLTCTWLIILANKIDGWTKSDRAKTDDDESYCWRSKENTTGRKLLGNRCAEQLLSLDSDSCDTYEENS